MRRPGPWVGTEFEAALAGAVAGREVYSGIGRGFRGPIWRLEDMLESRKQLLQGAYPLYRPLLTALGLLDYMARIHGVDKHTHGYLKHYQRYFQHLRFKKLKLFEIGVGWAGNRGRGGASLLMWRDYFPNAEIFGLDIEDKSHLQYSRIKIFQGDQNDPQFLEELASRWGPFDIVIDDGSHRSEHVITSFRSLYPHVKPNGFYVIEDLFFSYDKSVGGSSINLDDPKTSLGMLKTLIDDMHFKYIAGAAPRGFGEQITGIEFCPKLCFIRKGDNAGLDPTVEAFRKGIPREL